MEQKKEFDHNLSMLGILNDQQQDWIIDMSVEQLILYHRIIEWLGLEEISKIM